MINGVEVAKASDQDKHMEDRMIKWDFIYTVQNRPQGIGQATCDKPIKSSGW